jgi:hypothetical protein
MELSFGDPAQERRPLGGVKLDEHVRPPRVANQNPAVVEGELDTGT